MSTGIAIRANGDTANRTLKTAESGKDSELNIRCVSSQAHELAHDVADGNQAFMLRALLEAVTIALTPVSQTTDWHGVSGSAWLGAYWQAACDFARMVEAVAQDTTVYGKLSDDVLDLWVLAKRRDDALDVALAETMCELMRVYPHLQFDFMILEESAPAAATINGSGFVVVAPD